MHARTLRTTRRRLDFGPYSVFVYSMAALMVLLALSRLGLTAWNWSHVRGPGDLGQILLQGMRVDVASISRLYAPFILLFVISRLLPPPVRRLVNGIVVVGLTLVAVAFVFLEALTPTYILEYGTRPERKLFEYLDAPAETLGMLWLSFRTPVFITLCATAAAFVVFARAHRKWISTAPQWRPLAIVGSLPLLLLVLLLAGRATLHGKPLHPGQVAFTNDILLNNLALNSLFSASYAAYRLVEEVDPGELYGDVAPDKVRELVTEATRPRANVSAAVIAPVTPKNIVIVLEESLGARFVHSLGGADTTPNLDALADEGWWFERMYATGTRSVRGIEAVLSGFPPSPGRAVVRLVDSQSEFFTLASLLGAAGYRSGFYYGGRADFDNMRGFALSNGFDYIVDESNIPHRTYRTTYGYCDDDVFDTIHDDLSKPAREPKFLVTLTTSNHQPFGVPGNAEAGAAAQPNSRDNAVRYADAALGRFIRRAHESSYWNDTIILVVADHDARVAEYWSKFGKGNEAGDSRAFPIEGFHIPALILGGGIEPRHSDYIASQIDLPTTLLGLAGISGPHPMPGVDLSTVGEDYTGRAIMQFADYHAHLFGDELVVLPPSGTRSVNHYTLAGEMENRLADPAVMHRKALAFALWPSLVFREGSYRLNGML